MRNPFPCTPLFIADWTYTILVGALVTTYWRGTWVLLDIWVCGQPPDANLVDGTSFCFMIPALEDMPDGYYWNLRLQTARWTYLIGLGLLFLGIALLWSGAWVPRLTIMPGGSTVSAGEVTPSLAIVRFLIVYILGASAVCLWRGIWYWADAWIFPENPLQSYWTTSLVGSSVAFLFHAGASILAPPAMFLLDGPGNSPPPIGVTVLSSYYSLTLPYDEKPPPLPLYVRVLDVVGSFVFLPFAVVWFWRGTWMLCDNYFWGFSPDSQDLHASKLWGTIFSVICIVVTSEPVVALVDGRFKNKHVLGMFGRLRTYILAWGTVSLWRVAWYVWDEFLGGTSTTSAWVSHVVSLVCLTTMGCVSSINAPASTMGVDSVPHDNCADEPLFAMIPIPFELLYFAGIARQESARKVMEAQPKKEEVEMVETEREATTNAAAADGDKKRGLGPVDEEKTEDFLDWTTKMEGERIVSVGDRAASEGEIQLGPEVKSVSFVKAEQARAHSTTSMSGSRVNILRGTFLKTSDGSRVSYFEMQRPQLHHRTFTSLVQRPSEDNPRKRSHLHRSR